LEVDFSTDSGEVKREHRLVVHSSKKPMPSNADSKLVTKWLMEYRKDGSPKFRLVDPVNVAGTVLVREDIDGKSTHGLSENRVKAMDQMVYVAFDCREVWSWLFLSTCEDWKHYI
jgi:hypothetical protein